MNGSSTEIGRVNARLWKLPRPARGERVGVRGRWKEFAPHPGSTLRADPDLSPQAGRGDRLRDNEVLVRDPGYESQPSISSIRQLLHNLRHRNILGIFFIVP